MDLHYLSLVVEPFYHLGGLQGLHHAGEVDEAAPGVEEHLRAAQQPGHGVCDGELWGEQLNVRTFTLHTQMNNARDVRRGGHLTFVIPWVKTNF